MMMKQHKTVLNMAKFIQGQSLLLLEALNELHLDVEAGMCEKLHDEADELYCSLVARLGDAQEVV